MTNDNVVAKAKAKLKKLDLYDAAVAKERVDLLEEMRPIVCVFTEGDNVFDGDRRGKIIQADLSWQGDFVQHYRVQLYKKNGEPGGLLRQINHDEIKLWKKEA